MVACPMCPTIFLLIPLALVLREEGVESVCCAIASCCIMSCCIMAICCWNICMVISEAMEVVLGNVVVMVAWGMEDMPVDTLSEAVMSIASGHSWEAKST